MKITIDIIPSKIASEKDVLEAIASRLCAGDHAIWEKIFTSGQTSTDGGCWVDALANRVISIQTDNFAIENYQKRSGKEDGTAFYIYESKEIS